MVEEEEIISVINIMICLQECESNIAVSVTMRKGARLNNIIPAGFLFFVSTSTLAMNIDN